MGRKPSISREKLLTAIERSVVQRGVPPSLEELRRALKAGSTRTVLRHLRALEEAGDIERWPGARGIRLRRSGHGGVDTRPVPLVGQVPAGPLMTAEQNIEGYVRLPQTFLRPPASQFFLLRVRGNSMNQAHVEGGRIEDGDLVLVRQQAIAESGQIVVTLVDGEVTIKELRHAPGYWILRPLSTDAIHHPIVVGSDLQVLGLVQRVLKRGSELLTFAQDTPAGLTPSRRA
jgi:repressor LexA